MGADVSRTLRHNSAHGTRLWLFTNTKIPMHIKKSHSLLILSNVSKFVSECRTCTLNECVWKRRKMKFYMFISDDQEVLTDSKILELSKQFTTQLNLRDVAIKGLNISSRTVERHIQNNQNRITEAAYCLFQEWRDSQENLNTAYDKMYQALENIKMSYFKKAL